MDLSRYARVTPRVTAVKVSTPGTAILARCQVRWRAADASSAQLPEQRRHVALDGPDRDVQLVRDLRVAQVVAERLEYLGLTVGDPGRMNRPHRHIIADPAPESVAGAWWIGGRHRCLASGRCAS
jgi:hypothetical protein